MSETLAIKESPYGGRTGLSKKDGNYIPPESVQEILLIDALEASHRLPGANQLSLIPGDKAKENGVKEIKLYYAGDIELLAKPCVAIVGTRKASREGLARTRRLAKALAEADVTVVSGLAMGIDTAAHTSAIEAGGNTIAVLGTPLDKASPAQNKALQEKIYQNHLLISQFPIGRQVFRSNFPQRNKLMATISDATVVVEASQTSGTLHQAAECTRLGRWLFITRSLVENPAVTWPADFLKYETCVVLEEVNDILSRLNRR